MGKLARACVEGVVLLAVGIGVGLGANSVRGKNSINVCRDYFQKSIPPPPPPTQPNNPPGERPQPATAESAPRSSFQDVSLAEAAELYDRRNAGEAVVFIDARNDESYQAGHIPGAVQCDYYRIEYYLPQVMAAISPAEKIVVYCTGGDCEDSLLVCGELTNMVHREKLFLFRGGWTDWSAAKMPVATGSE